MDGDHEKEIITISSNVSTSCGKQMGVRGGDGDGEVLVKRVK